jgi:hypothetical protein
VQVIIDGAGKASCLDCLVRGSSFFKEMQLLKVGEDCGEEVVIFQSPALADIALDVCTPVQVKSITKALTERLEPNMSTQRLVDNNID